MKKTIIITLTILCSTVVSHAQRMYPGQSALQLTVSSVDAAFSKNTLSWSTGLQYSRYTQSGQWLAGAEYTSLRSGYADTYLPYSQITASGGYTCRIWSTYSRKIALHGGGLVIIGHEQVSSSSLPDGIYTSAASRMIYGISPVISLDMFVSRNIAIGIHVKENITFNSDIASNYTLAGIGIKYLIN